MTTEERKLELVENLKARCSESVEYTDEPIEFEDEPEMAIEEPEQFEMWIEDEDFAIDLTGF